MLLCGSLFMGLKWMQWIGLPFGETCKLKGYLMDSFFSLNLLQIKIVSNLFKILVFLEYRVTQN